MDPLPRIFRALKLRDTLSNRMFVVYGAAVLAFFGIVVAVTVLVIAPNFQRLDEAEAAHRREIVRQSVSAEMARLGDLTRTYAVWDDAYEFARVAGSDFITVNFSDEAIEQIELSEVLILDRHRRVLFRTAQSPVSNALSLSIAGAAAAAPAFIAPSARGVATAIVTAPDGAALVSVADIVRSDGTGEPMGRMVFARPLDGALLTRLRSQTNTDVSVDLSGARDGGANRIFVNDAYGRPTVSLILGAAASVKALAMRSLIVLSLIAVGAFFVVAVIMGRWLSNAVVHPVRELALSARNGRADLIESTGEVGPEELMELRAALGEAFQQVRDEIERQRAAANEAELARQAMERASRSKAVFFAQMSHELRTPLNAIIGYGELIEEEWSDGYKHLDDLRAILTSARQLLALLNEILELARFSGGQAITLAQSVNLAGALKKAIAPHFSEGRGEITIEIESGLETIVTDERKFVSALTNLLSHVAAAARCGEVNVFARHGRDAEERRIVISIAHDGASLGEEERHLLLEPMSSASSSSGALRLAMVRELVQALNGEIHVGNGRRGACLLHIVLPINVSDYLQADKGAA